MIPEILASALGSAFIVVGLLGLFIGGAYPEKLFDRNATALKKVWAVQSRLQRRIASLEERRREERAEVEAEHSRRLAAKKARRRKLERVWQLRVEGCHPRWIKEEVIDKDPWWLTNTDARRFAMDVLGPVSDWPDGPEPWSQKALEVKRIKAEAGAFYGNDDSHLRSSTRGRPVYKDSIADAPRQPNPFLNPAYRTNRISPHIDKY